MKKKSLIAVLLVLAMCFSLSACGEKSDLDIVIDKPISSEGVETTFTSMKGDAVMTPNFDVIETFEFEVKAVNNTGDENELWNVYDSCDLFGPDGMEVDKNISGPGYTMTGYTTASDKEYIAGQVLDGGYKEYTVAFPDPGLDGEYTLVYKGDYKLKFTVEHLEKEEGGTTITYPTVDGDAVYQAWPTK